jgi:hypothetical protein
LFDCGSFTLRQGEDLPIFGDDVLPPGASCESGGTAGADRTFRRGRPVPQENVTDDTGLIAVTVDISQDPYGGNRIERKVCSRVAVAATGGLAFKRHAPMRTMRDTSQ